MNKFLPSKKLLGFLVFGLVVLGCVFLFYKFKNRKVFYLTDNSMSTKDSQIINRGIQENLKDDSDGDGLKDWEEILWKTDPQKADTDGDGTDDNAEILANRNPLQAGPNDELAKDLNQQSLPEKEATEMGEKELTQTDILSRELFTGYVALKQNDQLGTEQETQFINNLVNKNFNDPDENTKIYTAEDLKIIYGSDQVILQQYIDKLKEINNLGNNIENSALIVQKALEKKDYQELQKLEDSVTIYQKMKNQLLQTEVPSTAIPIHLNFINFLEDMIESTTGMLTILDDPILGLNSVQNYFNTGKLLIENIKAMVDFCDKHKLKL